MDLKLIFKYQKNLVSNNVIFVIAIKVNSMTKKDFIEACDYHKYGNRNEYGMIALFFDWKGGENFRGFKYCVYARALKSNKKELINALYDLVFNDKDTDWWINCRVAVTDEERFKVPIVASGLRCNYYKN